MNSTEEYQTRVKQFQTKLQDNNIDAAIFFHQEEIFYFTGTGVHGTLIIPSNHEPIFLVRINFERGKKESFVNDVRPSEGMKTLVAVMNELYPGKKLKVGISFDVTTLQFFANLKRNFDKYDFSDIQHLVWSMRLKKSEWEISKIKQAANISYRAFEKGVEALENGMTEIELLKIIEQYSSKFGDEGNMVQRGSQNRLPFGVVAFGENTSVISGSWLTMTGSGVSASRPYGSGNRKIKNNDVVVIDKGTHSEGYHADEARTFVYGKATDKQKELHKILNHILDETIEFIRPGITIADIYNKAEKVAFSYGFKDEFMALGQYQFKYVGHGIGLEMDEPPLVSAFNNTIVEPGMVLAIEPKIIFPNEFGLTLEDTVVVTETGNEIVTSFPRDIFEI